MSVAFRGGPGWVGGSLGRSWTGWRIFGEDCDVLGDPSGGLRWVGETRGGSRLVGETLGRSEWGQGISLRGWMGRGYSGWSGTCPETFWEVRNGSWDRRGSPGRVRGILVRTRTGRGTLGVVPDGSGDP